MKAERKFNVFGEPVEVLVSSESGNGTLTVITQTCEPGGGPPPHVHDREDEFFTVLEGQFDLLDGRAWRRLKQGESHYSPRGTVHTFHNTGTTTGTILVAISPGGLDEYLEKLSPLALPQDEKSIVELSNLQGIRLIPGPELTEWFARLEARTLVSA